MSEPQYGQPPGFGPGPAPDNNLVWGVLITLLCCAPLGIVSIVKAAKVDVLWQTGQFDAARLASREARKWALWGALSWVVLIVLMFVVIFAFGGLAAVFGGGYNTGY